MYVKSVTRIFINNSMTYVHLYFPLSEEKICIQSCFKHFPHISTFIDLSAQKNASFLFPFKRCDTMQTAIKQLNLPRAQHQRIYDMSTLSLFKYSQRYYEYAIHTGQAAQMKNGFGPQYTHSVLIRNCLIRNTSENFGFFKKRLLKFSKLRNPASLFFQSKKQQSFCIYISAIISKVFVKIDYILKKNI